MFGILKKKITGLVDSIAKTISGGKEEKKEQETDLKSEALNEEIKVKSEEIKEEPKIKKEKDEIKTESKELKDKADEKESKKEEKNLILQIEEDKKKIIETKSEKERKEEKQKEVEIKVKPSLITKVKSIITPEVTIKEEDIKSALEDFEMQLLTADVAFEVSEEIINDLRKRLVGKNVKSNEIEKYILDSIYKSIEGVIQQENIDIVKMIKDKKIKTGKPYKILFVGPNGAGKTTTIAKVAYYLKKNGLSCVISASDTFRAAAIEQTVEHAKKLEIPYIKHDYGSDPAAVAFDAVKYAEARGIDVVLIDSAGRQETNKNLIEQLKKIERVISPDMKIFVGEGITGNALLTQVSEFNNAIKLDGVILTKLDVDAKGGTVISVRKATGIPIIFIGVGQEYDDLIPFDKDYILKRIMSDNN